MSARAVLAALAVLAAGCGYRLGGSAPDPLGPFVVTTRPAAPARAAVVAAAEAGARAELARAGELGACAPSGAAGCAALVLEVLRVEETSAAVVASPSGGAPLAGAVRVAVTGRGVVRRGDAEVRATGEVTASEVVGRVDGAVAGAAASGAAAERAARRLGERVARRALGLPEPSDE